MNIIPIATADGVASINGNSLLAASFAMDLKVDMEAFGHFGIEANPLDPFDKKFKQVATNFAGGTGTIEMKYDNTPGSRIFTDFGIWLGVSFYGYLGNNDLIGYNITGVVTGLKPESKTDAAGGATCGFAFEITGCYPTITGPAI